MTYEYLIEMWSWPNKEEVNFIDWLDTKGRQGWILATQVERGTKSKSCIFYKEVQNAN